MSTVKWALDASHSELVFKVKHLMISTVTGQFRKFNVTAESDGEDFSNAFRVELRAETASIDTNNDQRDNHLRSADFFDAAQFPELVFISNKYTGDKEEGELTGELTLHGITKPITFKVEQGGIATDPYGQTKAGFTVTGKLNRKDFGLTWSAVTEAGGVVVADEIKFHAEIQLVKQA